MRRIAAGTLRGLVGLLTAAWLVVATVNGYATFELTHCNPSAAPLSRGAEVVCRAGGDLPDPPVLLFAATGFLGVATLILRWEPRWRYTLGLCAVVALLPFGAYAVLRALVAVVNVLT